MQQTIPDRHDYYLMQIAYEVRKVLSRKPKSIKLEHFVLHPSPGNNANGTPNGTPERNTSKIRDKKLAGSLSKAAWSMRLGRKISALVQQQSEPESDATTYPLLTQQEVDTSNGR